VGICSRSQARGEVWRDTRHHPGIHLIARLLALLPRQAAQGGEGREEDAAVAENLLGPGAQRGPVLQTRGLLQEHTTEGGALTRAQSQMEPNPVLGRGDGRLALGIVLKRPKLHGQRGRHKDQQVVAELQGRPGGKAACEVEEPPVIGKSQAAMRATTAGNLGLLGGGKHHSLGKDLARIVHPV
jgi:hypothetical protein